MQVGLLWATRIDERKCAPLGVSAFVHKIAYSSSSSDSVNSGLSRLSSSICCLAAVAVSSPTGPSVYSQGMINAFLGGDVAGRFSAGTSGRMLGPGRMYSGILPRAFADRGITRSAPPLALRDHPVFFISDSRTHPAIFFNSEIDATNCSGIGCPTERNRSQLDQHSLADGLT